MRTVKFRGQCLGSKKWVYGSLITSDDGAQIHVAHNELYAVDPETVGQFTGLFDKNGTEIWEGDILQTWLEDSVEQNGGIWHRMHVVFTQEKGFALWGHRVVIEYAETLQEMLAWKQWDTIGNIHDNGELLENE